ncbi:MAG TPA: glycerophosphodiester phosphodiesterase, partial [Agromyces sp.]
MTRTPRRPLRILLATIGMLATATLLLIATTPTTASAVDVFGALRVPGEPAFIVGHRGDRAEAPENTMPSLELAMDDLDFVETDVRLSRDGVPVLFHDVTLERVTGDRRQASDLDL